MKKMVLFNMILAGLNLFSSEVRNQSIILPTYTYPGSEYWKQAVKIGGNKIGYVIINPSSGPGTKKDSNYVSQIDKVRKSGIKILAYIPTTYQKRPIEEVYGDIEKYFKLYGKGNIDGFFFDEIGVEKENEVNYMKELYNYVKNLSGNYMIVSNPGRQVTDKISPYSDIFVTSEISGDEYINRFTEPESEFEKNIENSRHIYHIVYDVKPEQYETVVRLSRKRNAGWLMITSDKLPNPYNDMPSEFSKLVDIILKK